MNGNDRRRADLGFLIGVISDLMKNVDQRGEGYQNLECSKAAAPNIFRSYLKNASNAQGLCYKPIRNARILTCMLHFRIGLRLALERDLLFLRQLL